MRNARGRAIPASEIPWMRVGEVWIHAVDLAAGVTWMDLPPDVIDALAVDVLDSLGAADIGPSARLEPTDRAGTWSLGPEQEPPSSSRVGEQPSWPGSWVGRMVRPRRRRWSAAGAASLAVRHRAL